MTVKNSPDPAFDEVAGVEYVPVPAWNQPQPQTANMIVAALGGGGNEAIAQPKEPRPNRRIPTR